MAKRISLVAAIFAVIMLCFGAANLAQAGTVVLYPQPGCMPDFTVPNDSNVAFVRCVNNTLPSRPTWSIPLNLLKPVNFSVDAGRGDTNITLFEQNDSGCTPNLMIDNVFHSQEVFQEQTVMRHNCLAAGRYLVMVTSNGTSINIFNCPQIPTATPWTTATLLPTPTFTPTATQTPNMDPCVEHILTVLPPGTPPLYRNSYEGEYGTYFSPDCNTTIAFSWNHSWGYMVVRIFLNYFTGPSEVSLIGPEGILLDHWTVMPEQGYSTPQGLTFPSGEYRVVFWGSGSSSANGDVIVDGYPIPTSTPTSTPTRTATPTPTTTPTFTATPTPAPRCTFVECWPKLNLPQDSGKTVHLDLGCITLQPFSWNGGIPMFDITNASCGTLTWGIYYGDGSCEVEELVMDCQTLDPGVGFGWSPMVDLPDGEYILYFEDPPESGTISLSISVYGVPTPTPTPLPAYTLNLQSGWQIKSLSGLPTAYRTAKELAAAIRTSSAGQNETIWIADLTTIGWKVYSNKLPFNNFTLDPETGYAIYVATPVTVTIAP